jgi:hypothetical protein
LQTDDRQRPPNPSPVAPKVATGGCAMPGGHCELIDGAVGLRLGIENMTPGGGSWWDEYRAGLESAAQEAPHQE